MSLLLFEKQVIGGRNGKKPRFVRRQHCGKCHRVLALQLTDSVEATNQGEYYVVNGSITVKGELRLLYLKERWFGNTVQCPACGSLVTLPIDKPISYEQMLESRQERLNARNN